MPTLVMKFGGTSVATLDRIRRAAKRVGREVANGYDVIVIVSAMAGKTNELVGWVEVKTMKSLYGTVPSPDVMQKYTGTRAMSLP